MKILILKPSSLGDVVQALPVLRLLKGWRPEAQVWWWIQKELGPLLEDDPDLAGLIPFDRNGWAWPHRWLELWRSLRAMRAHQFDWVIDLQSLARSGAFAWLANGGVLVGLDDSREGARGFYDIAVPRRTWHTHAVDWYLETLRALQVPVDSPFEWLPTRAAAARAVLSRWQPAGQRWLALVPGARWDNKRWPGEHYAALARSLAEEIQDLRIVVLGGGSDREIARLIAAAAPRHCLDLTGQTSLSETIEWLRLCDAVVTNDTGPMHLAAALRTPVVGLFGPTEPRRTGPYGQLEGVLQLELPCVPCMKSWCRYEKPLECLRALPVAAVAEKVKSLWVRPPVTDRRWRLDG